MILTQARKPDGSIDCYTCETNIRRGEGKVDAGHFLPKKRYPAQYYNRKNIRPQCFRCNSPGQGEQLKFFFKLCEELGEEEVLELIDNRHGNMPDDKDWYIREIRECQALLKAS